MPGNYLSSRLQEVQNLDFLLIVQETKGNTKLNPNWLPEFKCDFRSKNILRAQTFILDLEIEFLKHSKVNKELVACSIVC